MAATADRRTLRFATIDDALADVDALAEARARGTLRALGRWTFGQNLHHLATWIDYAYGGSPVRVPSFVPWLLRPLRHRIINNPLKPGVRIPRVPGGTYATEDAPEAEAQAHLRRSFARLAREAPTLPHPLLGRLDHGEWVALQLRHAELHLSFLAP